jgi:hypothetical protein
MVSPVTNLFSTYSTKHANEGCENSRGGDMGASFRLRLKPPTFSNSVSRRLVDFVVGAKNTQVARGIFRPNLPVNLGAHRLVCAPFSGVAL